MTKYYFILYVELDSEVVFMSCFVYCGGIFDMVILINVFSPH